MKLNYSQLEDAVRLIEAAGKLNGRRVFDGLRYRQLPGKGVNYFG